MLVAVGRRGALGTGGGGVQLELGRVGWGHLELGRVRGVHLD